MKLAPTAFVAIALLAVLPAVSSAQTVFLADDFDSYTDTSFIAFLDGGANGSATLVPDGSGGNALQITVPTTGGFMASGFDWVPAIQPGPGGPNISGDLAAYTLSYDLTIDSAYRVANGLELWTKDQPNLGANLYATGLGAFTQGVTQNVSYTLINPITTTPFGYPNGFSPTIPEWRIRMNGLDFGSPAGDFFTFTIDNFQVSIDIPESLALIVDPATGATRIQNISGEAISFDYYKIDSAEGALRTANFNGSTGWNSLADQQVGSLGPGPDQNWSESAASNSANQLVELFVLGETTLQPNQSISIGAPIDLALIADIEANPLQFTFGGPAYSVLAIGQVRFQSTEGLPGDYNNDGVVDAADYAVWRDNVGAPEGTLANDEVGGVIGQAQYQQWRSNYGASAGALLTPEASTIPEPTSALLAALCAIACGASVRRRKS